MPEEFMTVAEVAAILKLNQQTVRNWIDAGRLPALHVGRRVRIRRTDFDRLIDESYSGASSAAEVAPSIWDGEIRPPMVTSEASSGPNGESNERMTDATLAVRGS
jgi:excisionase family DNA binding protein